MIDVLSYADIIRSETRLQIPFRPCSSVEAVKRIYGLKEDFKRWMP